MRFYEISLLAGAFILIAFAFHLFTYTKGILLLNRLLAVLFLSRGVQNLFLLLVSLNQLAGFALVFELMLFLMYLAPAAAYLYVRSFTADDSKLHSKDLIHLIPPLIVLVNIIPLLFASYSDKLDMLNQFVLNEDLLNPKATILIPLRYQYIIRSLIFIIYLGFAWKVALKARKKERDRLYLAGSSFLYYFLFFLSLLQILALSASLYTTFSKTPVSLLGIDHFFISPIGILMLLFIMFLVRNPLVLYGNLQIAVPGPVKVSDSQEAAQQEDSETNQIPDIEILYTQEQIKHLLERIQNQMAHEKLFLDPDLNIRKLAEKSDLPVHHYSFLLNQVLNKKFREYINQYRINHCISQYSEDSEVYTLDFLSREAGFRNRKTFISAFKNETGLTPSKYFKRKSDSKTDQG